MKKKKEKKKKRLAFCAQWPNLVKVAHPHGARPAASLRYSRVSSEFSKSFLPNAIIAAAATAACTRQVVVVRVCLADARRSTVETPRVVFKGRAPDRASSLAGGLSRVVALKMKTKKNLRNVFGCKNTYIPCARDRPRYISGKFRTILQLKFILFFFRYSILYISCVRLERLIN